MKRNFLDSFGEKYWRNNLHIVNRKTIDINYDGESIKFGIYIEDDFRENNKIKEMKTIEKR